MVEEPEIMVSYTLVPLVFKYMVIYRVSENHQSCDGDAWDHWVSEYPISYHLSMEGASNKVQSLINEQLVLLAESRLRNPHILEQYWRERIKELVTNRIVFQIGTNRKQCERRERFVISELGVED